jgi:hypothetical protein
MIGLVRKSDSFGMLSYFTVVGSNIDHIDAQVTELNHWGDLTEIRARFTLIATRQNGVWYDIDGRRLSDEYIRPFLK